MSVDQTGHQPIKAIEDFIVNAMGANSLATRIDQALILEDYLYKGGFELKVAEEHVPDLEPIMAAYLRDPTVIREYLTTLQRSQDIIAQFKKLPERDVKLISLLLEHADNQKIQSIGDLFDHRSWVQKKEEDAYRLTAKSDLFDYLAWLDKKEAKKSGERYILPLQGENHYTSVNGPKFTAGASHLVLNFLNLDLPDTTELRTDGKTVTNRSWPVEKFDAYVAERRAAMTQTPELKARDLFLTWFANTNIDVAKVTLGHAFKNTGFIKLEGNAASDGVANLVHTVLDNCAIKTAIEQSTYVVPAVQPKQAAPVITPITPAEPAKEDVVVPFRVPAPGAKYPRTPRTSRVHTQSPVNMSAKGAKIAPIEMFPEIDREPIRPRPVVAAPVERPLPKVLPFAVLPPTPARTGWPKVRRVATAPGAFPAVPGFTAWQYEPARAKAEAGMKTLSQEWAEWNGSAQKERDRLAREAARAKPVIAGKLYTQRVGEPEPGPVIGSTDRFEIRVPTTRIRGDGIESMIHREPRLRP